MVSFSAGVPRVRRIFLCICVNRTIYVSLINGPIKAYINGIIGLFLVSQPSLSTAIGASDQDPLLSTGGGRIGKGNFSQDEPKGRDLLKKHKGGRHPGQLTRWIWPICLNQEQTGRRRTIMRLSSLPGSRRWRSLYRRWRESRQPRTVRSGQTK